MIQLQNVELSQGGRRLLADVSLTAAPGQVTVVLGPEGSGKTALADVICGVTMPDSGSVLLDGADIVKDPMAARRRVGYMPHDTAVYRDMTPSGQLRFVGQVLELSARTLADRVEKVLRRVGLGEVANTPIRALPRALLQRVTLAQALVSGTGNVVLVDPTEGLDAKQVFELRAILAQLAAESAENGEKPAVLLLTDNLTEACQLGEKVYVLEEGRVVGCAAPKDLAWLEIDDEKTLLRAKGGADSVRSCAEKAGASVSECVEEEPGIVRCVAETGKGTEGRKALFTAFAAANLPIVEMRPARRTMEEAVQLLKSETWATPSEGAEQK